MAAKTLVLKLNMADDKARQRAMKTVSSVSGIDLIKAEPNKLTIECSRADPVKIVMKLRKHVYVDVISITTTKDKEKDAPKKENTDNKKKEEPKKHADEELAGPYAKNNYLYPYHSPYPYQTDYAHQTPCPYQTHYPYPDHYYPMPYTIGENPNTCFFS